MPERGPGALAIRVTQAEQLATPDRVAELVGGPGAVAADLGFGDVPAKCNCISPDVFVAKYDLQGTPIWQKPFGGDGNDIPGQVDVDPWGRPVMAAR